MESAGSCSDCIASGHSLDLNHAFTFQVEQQCDVVPARNAQFDFFLISEAQRNFRDKLFELVEAQRNSAIA